jgi:signal transduction histidine kinase
LLARAGAQAPVSTEPVLIEKEIREVVCEHRQRFVGRSVLISVKPKALMVEAQPEYLRQVLQNLLGNAEKYSPSEQQIDIRAHRRGDEAIISVLDRGHGIDAAEAQIIFQPFYRSPRTAKTVGGAGIGLAVCKLLVQAQSGHIFTSARRGGGAILTFALPAAV